MRQRGRHRDLRRAIGASAARSGARRDPEVVADGAVEVGALLGGRYRLHRPVAVGATCTVWIADDTVLERRVAVKVLADPDADGDGDHAAFLERARLTARVEHPAIATTFDSGRDGCLYSVAELAAGARLEDVVASRGPVAPACAVLLARQLVEALHAVERSGVAYGGVDLDDIMISGSDSLTVTALRPRTDEVTVDPAASIAVGRAIYALLCGRPPVLSSAGTLLSPRQLRADVPRVLDELVMRSLRGLYLSAAAVGAALAALPPLDEPVARSVSVAPAPHRRVRHDTMLVSGVLLIAVLSVVVGVLFQSEGGRSFIRRVVPDVPVINPTPQSSSAATATTGSGRDDGVAALEADAELAPDPDPLVDDVALGTVVPVRLAHDFDPGGDDGAENAEDVRAAVDGDPATAWTSQRYANTDFGNLKAGLGLWVELPSATEVAAVRVHSPEGGWAASVYVADEAGTDLVDWGPARTAVTSAEGVADELVLDRRATGTAVLVWFTELPPSSLMTVTEIEVIGTVPSAPDGA